MRTVDFYGLPDVRIRGFSKFPTLETGIGARIPALLMGGRIVFACATRATDSNVAFKFAQEDILQRKSVCKAGLAQHGRYVLLSILLVDYCSSS